jgi:hypothetical protein
MTEEIKHVDDMDNAVQVQQPQALMPSDPAAVAAAERERARIAAQCQLALMNPRDEDQARDGMLRACTRKRFAEAAVYRVPKGGKPITGPSIRFAETALRCWGNIDTSTRIVYEDEDHIRMAVTVMDLQSNVSHTKEVKVFKRIERRKSEDREVLSQRTNSYGDIIYLVRARDDEVYMEMAKATSKVVRTEGLRHIPADILEECIDQINTTKRQDIESDPDKAKRQILDSFSAHLNIRPAELSKYLGHSVDTIAPLEIAELREVYTAIREGTATWAGVMEAKGQGVAGPAESLSERLKKYRGESDPGGVCPETESAGDEQGNNSPAATLPDNWDEMVSAVEAAAVSDLDKAAFRNARADEDVEVMTSLHRTLCEEGGES